MSPSIKTVLPPEKGSNIASIQSGAVKMNGVFYNLGKLAGPKIRTAISFVANHEEKNNRLVDDLDELADELESYLEL